MNIDDISPLRCAGALRPSQILAIARARCRACKKGDPGGHTCWPDPHVKLALGVISYDRFKTQVAS